MTLCLKTEQHIAYVAYVEAALELQGYVLDAAVTAAIARQFERIAAIASTMLDVDLPLDSEPAPLFRP